MALSIFSKATLIVKASAHSVLDKVIDANSVPAHEQLIRELEAAIQTESTECIRADVAAKAMHLQISAIQEHIDEFMAAIQANMDDGDPTNDGDQIPMAAHVTELQEELEDVKSQESALVENHRLLAITLDKLRERHTLMVKELQQLRRAVSQAKSDTQALNAVRKVQDLTTGVDSTHLGGALAAAKQQSAVAREELTQAVSGMQSTPEALLQKSKAQALLASMRAKAATPTA
jgi:acetolactate synthase small subunit